MADLVGVVEQFIELTGRVDLVVDAYAGDYDDAATGLGARHYINVAQRLLDRMQETPQSNAWHFVTPSAGTYTLQLQDCRAIKEVWLCTATARSKVERLDLSDFRAYYNGVISDYTNSTPEYYAIQEFRRSPSQQGTSLTGHNDTGDVISGDASAYQGIIWMPPSDGTFTLRIKGAFYSKALSNDTDTSYWTVNHPEALVLAAKFVLEGLYRNSEGLRDLQAAIAPYLESLDKDLVEEQIADLSGIDG